MKTYWGSGAIAPPFLTSALDGGENGVKYEDMTRFMWLRIRTSGGLF
jgi:hypothetical protein